MKILLSATCLLACLLAACTTAGDLPVKVIVGASLVDPSIPFSVIMIKYGKITDIGPQQTVPVPTASEKINGTGKYVIPIESGTKLQVGATADLMLVTDPKNSSTAERVMRAGKWMTAR